MNSLLHHYTSIHNLALILKTKKIRFSRLDLVDDMTEVSGMPRAFGTYIFVSCWTKDVEENIALWKMYTGDMRGVRISFPEQLFKNKKIIAGNYNGVVFPDDFHSPFEFNELCTEKYIIMPIFNDKNSFLKDIIYDDKYPDIYKSNTRDENGNFETNLYEFGKYKSEKWSFQKECRFILHCVPFLPLDHDKIMNSRDKQIDLINQSIFENHPNEARYIDVDIEEANYNGIIVSLGPLSTESDKIIVESLLQRYTTNFKLEDSSLKGVIRK